jgi:DegV family protein with EDD domain
MRPIKVVTDSCSDLTKELREKYNIDYLKMNTVKDGEETPASLDWEYYSPQDLYDTIRDGNRVTTTQVPAPTFEEFFKKWLDEGFDIIYIACSGKCSGSVNTGKVVAEELLKDYPDAKIASIDSLNASMGEGQVAIKAAKLRDQGLDFDAVVEQTMAVRNNVNQFVTVHNLNALKAAGRVKGSSAFFGNLLGVKPIIISNPEGDNIPIKKAKGRINSMQEIVDLTVEGIEDVENQTILVAHADCLDEAQEVVEMLKEKLPNAEIVLGYIGPIIGASIGADAIGIFSWGKNIDRFGV